GVKAQQSEHRDPGSCSSTCSNSAEEQVKSGRCWGNWLKSRIEIDRFGGFWTRVLRVRDREAPGSNPGPPTILAFETRDFRRRPVPTGHSRVTISWTAIAASG